MIRKSYHFNRPFGRMTYFKKQGNVNFTNIGSSKLKGDNEKNVWRSANIKSPKSFKLKAKN